MPNEDVESELLGLRPCEPSAELGQRIARELDCPPAASACVVTPPARWGWLALAATVVVVIAAGLALPFGRRPPRPTVATPPASRASQLAGPRSATPASEAASYLVDVQDEGLVYASATTPLRKIRYQYITTAEWQDEADHTTVQVLAPREATILVPVNVQ